MASSPEEMAKKMIQNMPEKTGKPLEDWLQIVVKSDLQKHGQIVKFLKSQHQMTHGFANLVAHHALASDESVDFIAAQYSGNKTELKPLYDQLIKLAKSLGSELEISPKKTCVSLRRNKQFAVITPATKTRIDLGINLKGVAGTTRLVETKNAMCTHKIGLTQLEEVDGELTAWLQQAFEMG